MCPSINQQKIFSRHALYSFTHFQPITWPHKCRTAYEKHFYNLFSHYTEDVEDLLIKLHTQLSIIEKRVCRNTLISDILHKKNSIRCANALTLK